MLLSILTRPIFFGVDALALLGFAFIGLGVGLKRAGMVRSPIAISLQMAGAALMVAGFLVPLANG